jgi:hypothetical protein
MNQAVIERSTNKAEDFPGWLPCGAPDLADFKMRAILHTGVLHRRGLGLRVHTTAFGTVTFFPADTRGVTIRDVNTGVGRTPFGVGAADSAASNATRMVSLGTASPRTRRAALIISSVIFTRLLQRALQRFHDPFEYGYLILNGQSVVIGLY